uniref:Uncharacterized protein n=1 Tax=Steinernema glaseri TaxID=37863 RepID=A0A1I7YBP2_9BILA
MQEYIRHIICKKQTSFLGGTGMASRLVVMLVFNEKRTIIPKILDVLAHKILDFAESPVAPIQRNVVLQRLLC